MKSITRFNAVCSTFQASLGYWILNFWFQIPIPSPSLVMVAVVVVVVVIRFQGIKRFIYGIMEGSLFKRHRKYRDSMVVNELERISLWSFTVPNRQKVYWPQFSIWLDKSSSVAGILVEYRLADGRVGGSTEVQELKKCRSCRSVGVEEVQALKRCRSWGSAGVEKNI